MTLQEIFNKVWQHFIVENNPRCYVPDYNCCYYRDPNGSGSRCAIGLFIPDEKYTRDLESWGPGSQKLLAVLPEGFGSFGVRSLMMSLRHIHDDSKDNDEMRTCLAHLATGLDLEVPTTENTKVLG